MSDVVNRIRDAIYERNGVMQSDRQRMADRGAIRCDLVPDNPQAFIEVYVRLHWDTATETMVTGEDRIYRYKWNSAPFDPAEGVAYQAKMKRGRA